MRASRVSSPGKTVQSLLTSPYLLLGILLLISLSAAFPLFASTPYGGAIVSPDSVHYLAASHSLLRWGDYLRYDEHLYTTWTPLYPTLLAGISLLANVLGVPLINLARVWQLAAYAGVVFAAGLLFRQHLQSRLLVIAATLGVLLAPPLLRVSALLWSEPLFILFTLVFFLLLPGALAGSRRAFAALVTAAALASIQRYTGVLLIPVGALTLLLCASVPLRRRIRQTIVFSVLASIPLALWIARNLMQTGTPMGSRPLADDPLLLHLERTFTTLRSWLTSLPLLEGAAPLGLLILGLLIVGGVFAAYRRGVEIKTRQVVLALGLFCLIYTVFILVSAFRYSFDPVDHRLLSPLYVPQLCLTLITLDRIGGWIDHRLGRVGPGRALALALTLVWLVYAYDQTDKEIDALNSCARCGTWRDSPVIAWLKQNPLDGALYSNTPLPLYMGVPSFGLPSKLDAIATRTPRGNGFYVVWFDDRYEDDCSPSKRFCYSTDYDFAEMSAAYTLEPITTADDGSVYRLTPKPG